MRSIKYFILLAIYCYILGSSPVLAQNTVNTAIDFERLADAIYKAENSKEHPYGIMTRYKHTTPRQACLNTIKRAYRDWEKLPQATRKPYLSFLQARYCPTEGIGLRPAERALNGFWLKNVTYFYNKEGVK